MWICDIAQCIIHCNSWIFYGISFDINLKWYVCSKVVGAHKLLIILRKAHVLLLRLRLQKKNRNNNRNKKRTFFLFSYRCELKCSQKHKIGTPFLSFSHSLSLSLFLVIELFGLIDTYGIAFNSFPSLILNSIVDSLVACSKFGYVCWIRIQTICFEQIVLWIYSNSRRLVLPLTPLSFAYHHIRNQISIYSNFDCIQPNFPCKCGILHRIVGRYHSIMIKWIKAPKNHRKMVWFWFFVKKIYSKFPL